MKILYAVLILALEVFAGFEESPFFKFNHQGLMLTNYKPENQDKIILYHGQTYGVWMFHLILKAFMFPEANEDWLPLRFASEGENIDKTDLMRLIGPEKDDHDTEYKKIGLSVSPNLVSSQSTESSWGSICIVKRVNWPKISGLSDMRSSHKNFYHFIREKFVSDANWKTFIAQKKLINQFIQVKRKLPSYYVINDFKLKIESLFPKTLKRFYDEFQILFDDLKDYPQSKLGKYYEGVALQIIMDRNLADELTYNANPFGWVKSTKHKKFEFDHYYYKGGIWNGEDIKPYSEIYDQVKNKNDNEQARLAMNKDFVSFPSRVRIRPIAGIMKNPKDYEIVKSMIRELVEGNKRTPKE